MGYTGQYFEGYMLLALLSADKNKFSMQGTLIVENIT